MVKDIYNLLKNKYFRNFFLSFTFFLFNYIFADQINVYFTDPTNSNPAVSQISSNQKPIDFALRDFVLSANSGTTMYVCIYEVNNTTITTAIDEVVNRGVKVYSIFNVAVNTSVFKTNFYYKQYGSSGSQYMHNKFVVIKSSKVWTGSYNFTVSATKEQDNFALEIFSKDLADIYEQAFNYIWAYGSTTISTEVAKFNGKEIFVDGISIKTYFNPYSQNPELASVLVQNWYDSSNEISKVSSLYFSVAWFTESSIVNTIKTLKSKGVLVKGIIDDDSKNFDTYYSLWNSSVPIYFDARRTSFGSGLMHHKFCVSDPYKVSGKVIAGSANWSDSALRSGRDKNYENILVIQSQSVAEKFYLEYLRLYEKISDMSYNSLSQEIISKIKLYPNPVKTSFKISFIPSIAIKKIDFYIYSIYGRKIFEQKNVSFYPEIENIVLIQLPLDINDGIYYFVIEASVFQDRKKYYQKFVVEK